MGNIKTSAKGERAAMGGYLPQFDEFSRQVYRNLINNNLEWIRVADPEAEKLDDIQFSTVSEIFAYQIKWTISDTVISYSNFIALFPKLTASWKRIKYNNPNKRVIPHLLTNKTISFKDKIELDDGNAADFGSFIDEAWLLIKTGQPLLKKWEKISQELQNLAKLDADDYKEFMSSFVFIHSYQPKPIAVSQVQFSKEQEDLQKLSRFIIEKTASKNRIVEFNRQQILDELLWTDRFRSTFNHDLIVDLKTYQPITSTINNLDKLLNNREGGYVFLEGGPGSGKSTMLTQWGRNSKHQIIKYYAFDFTNPASGMNYHERGSSISLFFDLVLQIKGRISSTINVIPYKDLDYLRKTFFSQLEALSDNYKKNGTKTVLIIDGLDHIPREYKTLNTFLRDLPLPLAIPSGVYIVLGSQSYSLEDLSVDIISEYKTSERTIKMDAMNKAEVYKYIQSNNITPSFSPKEKLQVYENSQGHPLYLSYLIEKLRSASNRTEAIKSFEKIDGNIDLYYQRLWKPIENMADLVNLLGIIARVNGSVNPSFMGEWGFSNDVLILLRNRAKFLFDVNENWSFFHNSFRQFLLHHTALDILTEKYSPTVNERYHATLAEFYGKSKVEPSWKKNFHLYQSGNYTAFIEEANPDLFNEQVYHFRPLHEIKTEAKLGVEIANKTDNPVILLRYLFTLSELEQKSRNIDPTTWTKRLIKLDKAEIAKRYIRSENKLLCTENTALRAAVTFAFHGDQNEGLLLFNMAYPEFIKENTIELSGIQSSTDEISMLRQWVYTSAFFLNFEEIMRKINSVKIIETKKTYRQTTVSEVRLRLLGSLASAYLSKNDWHNFDRVLGKYKTGQVKQLNAYYYVLTEAIEHCLTLKLDDLARHYLSELLKHFDRESSDDFAKLEIANLIYKSNQDVDSVKEWLKDVPQQSNVGESNLGYDESLTAFRPLILHNKLLNIIGEGIEINKAIPGARPGSDEELIVEYERMLCLIAKLLAEGSLKTKQEFSIRIKVNPIVTFFYKKRGHRNSYANKIFATKKAYYGLLVVAVAGLGKEYLTELGNYLINEFGSNSKFWSVSLRRSVILHLLDSGFDKEVVDREISSLEDVMLKGSDINERIEQCEAQSDAYFTLAKNEKSISLLQQALKESIGVAYSKDYQYTSWLDWLIKINDLQPDKAPVRLNWFLSHLDHINDTTEGGTFSDAIEKLLEATLRFDLESGHDQMQWMLKNGNINFGDALGMLLKESLKRCTETPEYLLILSFYTEIYLLFSEHKDIKLLQEFLDTGKKVDDENFDGHISSLLNAIQINAMEQHRDQLIETIIDFCSTNTVKFDWHTFETTKSAPIKDIYSDRNELVTEPYKTLSEKEVITSITDYKSLKELILNESIANSYFDWNNVLSLSSPMLTLENIRELGNVGVIKKKRSDYYARLSGLALQSGDRVLSKELADKSLESSTNSGWVEQYDGGSRLQALRALSDIDEESTYAKAFALFCYDVLDSNYPTSYLIDMHKILPIISKDYGIEDYWPEIESYLNRLMQNSTPIHKLPNIGKTAPNIYKVLTDCLLGLIDSPVSLMPGLATKVLAITIANGNEYAIEKVLLLTDDQKVADICMYLNRVNIRALKDFKDRLKIMSDSVHYTVRSNARLLLKACGEQYVTENSKLLPVSYTLHLSGNPEFAEEIFQPLLHLISVESQIDISNIEQRLSYFSNLYSKPEKWTESYEDKIRKNLDAIGLRYPWRRQKLADIRNALMYIVAELQDCGVLDMDAFALYFTFFDYAVPFYPAVRKPSFIPVIKIDGAISIRTGWVAKIDESPRLNTRKLFYMDQLIIGESYTIASLDWGRPTESYSSALSCLPYPVADKKVFGSIFHMLSDDYHTLKNTGPEIIVERNHNFLHFDNRATFIAINPALARMLKWVPNPKGLFEWSDAAGNFMVKSVFWSSGNSEMAPRKDSEVGEGWIVIASKKAILQIEAVTNGLFYQKKVKRFQGNGEDKESASRIKVVEFDMDQMYAKSTR